MSAAACDLDHDDDSCSSHEFDFAEQADKTYVPATVNTKTTTATKTASALMVAASAKAGMEDVDRERINAILLRESGNSSTTGPGSKSHFFFDNHTSQLDVADMAINLAIIKTPLIVSQITIFTIP